MAKNIIWLPFEPSVTRNFGSLKTAKIEKGSDATLSTNARQGRLSVALNGAEAVANSTTGAHVHLSDTESNWDNALGDWFMWAENAGFELSFDYYIEDEANWQAGSHIQSLCQLSRDNSDAAGRTWAGLGGHDYYISNRMDLNSGTHALSSVGHPGRCLTIDVMGVVTAANGAYDGWFQHGVTKHVNAPYEGAWGGHANNGKIFATSATHNKKGWHKLTFRRRRLSWEDVEGMRSQSNFFNNAYPYAGISGTWGGGPGNAPLEGSPAHNLPLEGQHTPGGISHTQFTSIPYYPIWYFWYYELIIDDAMECRGYSCKHQSAYSGWSTGPNYGGTGGGASAQYWAPTYPGWITQRQDLRVQTQNLGSISIGSGDLSGGGGGNYYRSFHGQIDDFKFKTFDTATYSTAGFGGFTGAGIKIKTDEVRMPPMKEGVTNVSYRIGREIADAKARVYNSSGAVAVNAGDDVIVDSTNNFVALDSADFSGTGGASIKTVAIGNGDEVWGASSLEGGRRKTPWAFTYKSYDRTTDIYGGSALGLMHWHQTPSGLPPGTDPSTFASGSKNWNSKSISISKIKELLESKGHLLDHIDCSTGFTIECWNRCDELSGYSQYYGPPGQSSAGAAIPLEGHMRALQLPYAFNMNPLAGSNSTGASHTFGPTNGLAFKTAQRTNRLYLYNSYPSGTKSPWVGSPGVVNFSVNFYEWTGENTKNSKTITWWTSDIPYEAAPINNGSQPQESSYYQYNTPGNFSHGKLRVAKYGRSTNFPHDYDWTSTYSNEQNIWFHTALVGSVSNGQYTIDLYVNGEKQTPYVSGSNVISASNFVSPRSILEGWNTISDVPTYMRDGDEVDLLQFSNMFLVQSGLGSYSVTNHSYHTNGPKVSQFSWADIRFISQKSIYKENFDTSWSAGSPHITSTDSFIELKRGQGETAKKAHRENSSVPKIIAGNTIESKSLEIKDNTLKANVPIKEEKINALWVYDFNGEYWNPSHGLQLHSRPSNIQLLGTSFLNGSPFTHSGSPWNLTTVDSFVGRRSISIDTVDGASWADAGVVNITEYIDTGRPRTEKSLKNQAVGHVQYLLDTNGRYFLQNDVAGEGLEQGGFPNQPGDIPVDQFTDYIEENKEILSLVDYTKGFALEGWQYVYPESAHASYVSKKRLQNTLPIWNPYVDSSTPNSISYYAHNASSMQLSLTAAPSGVTKTVSFTLGYKEWVDNTSAGNFRNVSWSSHDHPSVPRPGNFDVDEILGNLFHYALVGVPENGRLSLKLFVNGKEQVPHATTYTTPVLPGNPYELLSNVQNLPFYDSSTGLVDKNRYACFAGPTMLNADPTAAANTSSGVIFYAQQRHVAHPIYTRNFTPEKKPFSNFVPGKKGIDIGNVGGYLADHPAIKNKFKIKEDSITTNVKVIET